MALPHAGLSRASTLGLVALAALLAVCAVLAVLVVDHTRTPESAASVDVGAEQLLADARPPVVTVVGGSLVAGSSADSGDDARWPALLDLPESPVVNVLAADGAGYLVPGAGDATLADLAAQIPVGSDVVVIVAGRADALPAPYDAETEYVPAAPEDGAEPLDEATQAAVDAAAIAEAEADREREIRAASRQLTLEARQLFRQVQRVAPEAEIVVLSPLRLPGEAAGSLPAQRDAIRTAAAQADVDFVDALRWLSSAPAASVAADGEHLTDAGHARLAERISTELADTVPTAG